MKILFLATYFPKPGNPTIGTWALEQAKAFHESAELEVKVLSGNPWFPKFAGGLKKGIQAYADCPSEYSWNGVEVFYPKMLLYPFSNLDFVTNRLPSLFLNIGWFTISKAVHKILADWRPDVVYAHHTIPNGYFAMRIKQETGIPFFVTEHEMGEITACEFFPARRKIYDKVSRAAHCFVAVGRVMKEDIQRTLPNARCEVIHNGFNSSVPCIAEPTVSSHLSKMIILSCGMFYGRKNFTGLIQAFNLVAPEYPSAILRICGDGPDAPNILAEIKKSPYKNRVEWLGKVLHDEIRRQMAFADIFALIGWREPFGVVYLEAMAAGLPVLACNDGGFADIVQDGVDAFLVPPRNVQAASEKLRLLLGDPILRKKIANAGQEKAHTQMTWSAITKRYVEIFKNAITENSCSTR